MPTTQEDKKFYIRAPSLDYPRDGPIKIGNIITDAFRPQDDIANLSPISSIIDGASFGEGKKEHEKKASKGLDLSAKIYAAFGGRAEAKHGEDVKTVYDFDQVDTLMLQTNPRSSDMAAIRDTNTEVQAALKKGPVYIITGLKIARGLKYSNVRSTERKSGLGGKGQASAEVAVEANVEANTSTGDIESYTVMGDIVLAYRLHIVKKEGWKWRGEAALESKSHWPASAGFMNKGELVAESGVETAELSLQDLSFLAEEEGYEGTEGIDVADGEEEWRMMCFEV
jgi:hypothetical protein